MAENHLKFQTWDILSLFLHEIQNGNPAPYSSIYFRALHLYKEQFLELWKLLTEVIACSKQLHSLLDKEEQVGTYLPDFFFF